MLKRLAGFFLFVVASVVLLIAVGGMDITIALANSTSFDAALSSFCGACTDDDDCGVDHKCCTSGCSDGKKKCVKASTCSESSE